MYMILYLILIVWTIYIYRYIPTLMFGYKREKKNGRNKQKIDEDSIQWICNVNV